MPKRGGGVLRAAGRRPAQHYTEISILFATPTHLRVPGRRAVHIHSRLQMPTDRASICPISARGHGRALPVPPGKQAPAPCEGHAAASSARDKAP